MTPHYYTIRQLGRLDVCFKQGATSRYISMPHGRLLYPHAADISAVLGARGLLECLHFGTPLSTRIPYICQTSSKNAPGAISYSTTSFSDYVASRTRLGHSTYSRDIVELS